MNKVFLGLGTNLGNREDNLMKALARIKETIGPVTESSSLYETEPWGFESEEQFINMVVRIDTGLNPGDLLQEILNVEFFLGRKRSEKQYTSRVIDIDILLYGEKIVNEQQLKIPHPRMHERRFVLEPMCEIAGEEIHPVFGKSFARLLDECKDESKIEKIK